jgi:hypothetical protein
MAGPSRCQGRFPAILILLVVVMLATYAPGATEIVCEPGVPAGDGSWVLPVSWHDEPGNTVDWTPDAWAVRLDDRRVVVNGIVTYALQGGDGRMAALVLFDELRDADNRPASAKALAAALQSRISRPGVMVAAARCKLKVPTIPRPGDDSADGWLASADASAVSGARLWDGVLEALTVLAEPGLPDRRVLILVSDGREEMTSTHVPASCVDAAQRARIAIYVVSAASGQSGEVDAARLHDLATRTGGQAVVVTGELDQGVVDAAADDLVARIAAVHGLRLTPSEDPLPVTLRVSRPALTEPSLAGPTAVGDVAARQTLRRVGARRWVMLGGGLAAIIGAGVVLWRQRNVSAGELLVTTAEGTRRFPVLREGVTIGSDQDNSLVLASRRVSGHHAVIRVRGRDVVLTDLRSTRGTLVNGEAVATHTLVTGDRILVGREVELVFRRARGSGRRDA